MKYTGINHLAMATGDMDSTIRFWRDLLGMRLIGGLGEPGFRHYFFEISRTDTIAFFEWPGAKSVKRKPHGEPVKGPIVFDHIAFGMDSSEAVWELKDRLEAAEVECSNMIDHGFIHSIYAFDPNGIPIEFSYEVEGIFIHNQPVMGDPAPPVSAKEGSEPQLDYWPAISSPTLPSERNVRPGAGSDLFRKHDKKE
jgi:catechol 2,3-dioxygenase-like lactoylglutathione lyase family enzyme